MRVRTAFGAINIQTGEKTSAGAPATNFSIVRLKRDILRRSTVGLIATRRDPSGIESTPTWRAARRQLRVLRQLERERVLRAHDTPPVRHGSGASYRTFLRVRGDRYGAEVEHLAIGADFNPEVGYIRRSDFRRTYGLARFSPRTPRSRLVRKLSWQGSLDYVEDEARTVVQNRSMFGSFDMEFNSGDAFAVDYQREYQFIRATSRSLRTWSCRREVTTIRTCAWLFIGQQRKVSGQVAVVHRVVLWRRHAKKEASYSGYIGLYSHWRSSRPGPRVGGPAVRRVHRPRAQRQDIVTPNPRMVLSGLMQFDATTHSQLQRAAPMGVSPGSELFVVYSDGRDTLTGGVPNVINRSFAIKLTRLIGD